MTYVRVAKTETDLRDLKGKRKKRRECSGSILPDSSLLLAVFLFLTSLRIFFVSLQFFFSF